VKFCVKAPPRRGPTTEARPKILPIMLWYIGRFARGTVWTIMIIEPEKMPEEPSPAMARPIMSAVEFGAAPQIADPTSKIRIARRKTILEE
jgi:hypothetical protein